MSLGPDIPVILVTPQYNLYLGLPGCTVYLLVVILHPLQSFQQLNHVPEFMAQHAAVALRYQQLLWLLGNMVTEAGTTNIFAVFDHVDSGA